MKRILVILVGFSLLFFSEAFGATYYTAASGDITGNIWATTTNGTPGALPALANNDIIYIDDDITITTNFDNWKNRTLTIYLNSTIEINGIWGLNGATVVIFQSSAAKVISLGGGNSDKIRFGNGNAGWSGNDGNLTGPGQLDASFDPNNSPLPIELLFFNANQAGEKVSLSWATASELNFDYFSLERSIDGMEFIEMEQIKGRGTTNERKDYSLIDGMPVVGKNYYRLKSVDFDGYTEYFNVVVVNFSGEKTFSIAPNPTDGTTLTFWTNFVPDASSSITIFDNYSGVIGRYNPMDFNQPIGFATPLKSGLYFAKIVSKDFVRVERFIVH